MPDEALNKLVVALNNDERGDAREAADTLYDWLYEGGRTPEVSPKAFRTLIAHIRTAL